MPIPGLGTVMGYLAMIYFFETRCVEMLVGEMIKTNKKSHRFNLSLGFRAAKELIIHRSDGVGIDSILLIQTKNDWLFKSRQTLKERLLLLQ